MTRDDRLLGMHRRIPRRDFIQDVATSAVAGAFLSPIGTWLGDAGPASLAQQPSDDYPPARTGLRGQHPGSFAEGHRLRDGAYATLGRAEIDTGEEYDLIVVGGGISGLAAAYFFRAALGANQRVLILDNHDDFGGHAKRNEFTHAGRLYIGYGGTQSISTPFPYSFTAKSLIRELGIDVARYPEFLDRDLYARHGLKRGTFFDRETFGEDRLVAGTGSLPWAEFFGKAPLTDRARRDLVRVHTEEARSFPELTPEQRAAKLSAMSYQDYLVQVADVTSEALPFFAGRGGRNNKRMDTIPALEAARSGWPGFRGMALPAEATFDESSYSFHFPDGGATVARLLINRLVPAALPGDLDMSRVVLARLDYSKLDRAEWPVRVRLQSTAVRVEHDGAPERARHVRVVYSRGGRLHEVRARACVLACFHSVIPHLVPALPDAQKAALGSAVKVPMMYSNAFIRNWEAFVTLGVSSVDAPTMYHTSLSLDYPVSMGGYECPKDPRAPIVVHLVRNPNQPGLPRRAQQRAGMADMLSTSFESIERHTRGQLARILGPGGFDPARDLLALTVNRYPHGYAYTYDSLSDPEVADGDRPHVIGRKPFGLMAIANADAGAAAFINVAIDEAHRAVQELLQRRGLK
jgi:spermidine dehydrogenase